MFKSKKAQMLAFAVVLVIMIIFGVIIGNAGGDIKIVSEIGGKQINMLNAYAEAEKAREYVKFSAEHSAAITAQRLGVKTGQENCFTDLDTMAFQNQFNSKMTGYLGVYNSTNPEFNVSELIYSYNYDFQDNVINIMCFAQPDIIVKSNKVRLTYRITGYVEVDFSCDEYTAYSSESAKFLPV